MVETKIVDTGSGKCNLSADVRGLNVFLAVLDSTQLSHVAQPALLLGKD